MNPFFESGLFWSGFSALTGFALTYWILKNPAPFLVLLGLFIGLWVLFGPFGSAGFVVAAAVRMARPVPHKTTTTRGKRKRT